MKMLLLLLAAFETASAQPTLEQMRAFVESNPYDAGAHSNYGVA